MADFSAEITDGTEEEMTSVTEFAIDEENSDNKTDETKEINTDDTFVKVATDFYQLTDVCDEVNDDDVNDLDRSLTALNNLVSSPVIHRRCIAAKKLVEILNLFDSNEKKFSKSFDVVLIAVGQLLEDEDESVKCEFLNQLPEIGFWFKRNINVQKCFAKYIKHCDNIYLWSHLLTYVVEHLSSNQLQIRKAAHLSLQKWLENNLVDESQLSDWICPLVSELVMTNSENPITIEFFAYSNANPLKLRREDVSAMCKISPLVGKDLTSKFFLEPFVSLCADPCYEIREVCAKCLHYLDVVGQELSESTLLQSFINLCNDDQRVVQRACIEVFVETSKCFNRKVRREILTDVFINLLCCKDLTVNKIACQCLGTFISTFRDSPESISCNPSKEASKCNEQQFIHLDLCKSSVIESNTLHTDSVDVLSENNKLQSSENNKLQDVKNSNSICSPSIEYSNITEKTSETSEKPLQNSALNVLSDIYNENKIFQNSFETSVTKGSILNSTYAVGDSLTNIPKSSEIEYNCFHQPDNKNTILEYNSFLYWKFPIPEIECDEDFGQNFRKTEELKKHVPVKKIQRKSIFKKSNKKEFNNLIQDIVPDILLKKYVNLAMGTYGPGYCAESFSTVVCTLGSKNWGLLQSVFISLSSNLLCSVRMAIASNLHEVAAVLDQETIAEDILPVFLRYLLGDSDEVHFEVLQHLEVFLKLGGDDVRRTISERLCFLPCMQVRNQSYWRQRLILIQNLMSVLDLFSPLDMEAFFIPFAVKLFTDKVSVVRQAAVEMLASVMKHLASNEDTIIHVHQTLDLLLKNYKNANKWKWRQTYVNFCEQIIIKETLTKDFYVDQIVPPLFSLVWDSVPNVRLSVARCISRSLIPLGYISTIEKNQNELFKQVLCSLHTDVEKDVRHFAIQAFNAVPYIEVDAASKENSEEH